MIDLKQLVQIAPYEETTRQEILGKIDSLSEDQKRQIENLSWEMINNKYELDLSYATQIAIQEGAQGTKTIKDIDLDQIENKIFDTLSASLEKFLTASQIQEVREKLQTTTPSNPQVNLQKAN